MATPKKIAFVMLAASVASLAACATAPAGAPAAEQPSGSILVSSAPAAGSTVAAPVNSIELRFNPPARLDELTISGPDGMMPMMVHSVGEVADYSVPVSGLPAGQYTANWKAFVATREYRGSFAFTVK